MTSIRITLAAMSFAAAGLAQASEITQFTIPADSTVNRATVQAQALQLRQQVKPAVDLIRDTVKPASNTMASHDGVRQTAALASRRGDLVSAWYHVGGM